MYSVTISVWKRSQVKRQSERTLIVIFFQWCLLFFYRYRISSLSWCSRRSVILFDLSEDKRFSRQPIRLFKWVMEKGCNRIWFCSASYFFSSCIFRHGIYKLNVYPNIGDCSFYLFSLFFLRIRENLMWQ